MAFNILALQNLGIQTASLFLGILGGFFISWLSQEELNQYKKHVRFLAPRQHKYFNIFFLFAPLLLVLATQTKEIFFVALVLFFIVTLLTTMMILSNFVKNKKLVWKNEITKELLAVFWKFLGITVVIYSVLFFW